MSFFVDLWESIFTPGTSPALLTATHASFVLLLLSLLSLIYITRSIHYINLFVIALCLYGAVIWFVEELKQAKLKDNAELATEEEKKEAEQEEKVEEAVASGVRLPVKKRKV